MKITVTSKSNDNALMAASLQCSSEGSGNTGDTSGGRRLVSFLSDHGDVSPLASVLSTSSDQPTYTSLSSKSLSGQATPEFGIQAVSLSADSSSSTAS